jgi:hypothetical protein
MEKAEPQSAVWVEEGKYFACIVSNHIKIQREFASWEEASTWRASLMIFLRDASLEIESE